MPKFVIERQYLLPIYQRLIIDAPDIATACQEAVEDDDWESADEDGDGSGATTISAAREIPEGLVEQIERGEIHAGSFLLGRPARLWAAPRYPQTIPRVTLTSPDMQQRVGVEASEPSGIATCQELSRTQTRCPARPFVGLCGVRGAAQQFNPWTRPTRHGLSLSSAAVGGS